MKKIVLALSLFVSLAHAQVIIPRPPSPTWKTAVASPAGLPATGNAIGDSRVSKSDHTLYIWDGSAWQLTSSGIGTTAWGAITGTLSAQTDLWNALGYIPQGSPGSPVLITAAGGITSTADRKQVVYTVSSVGVTTITANPQISAGTKVGDTMLVEGTSDANYIIFNDGNGLYMNGPIMLKANVGVSFHWNGVVWHEDFRNN